MEKYKISSIEEPIIKIDLSWIIVLLEIVIGLSGIIIMVTYDMYKLRKNGFRKDKKYTYTCTLNEKLGNGSEVEYK